MRCTVYLTANLKDWAAQKWASGAAARKIIVISTAREVVEIARRLHGACRCAQDINIKRLYWGNAVSLEINKDIVVGDPVA